MMRKDFEDEFVSFLGSVTRAYTKTHNLPIYGRLISLSRDWLTFEKVDGRRVLVRRSEVLTIEPARERKLEQQPPQEAAK